MTEKWMPVPGYEGYYEVSDQGRVLLALVGLPTASPGREGAGHHDRGGLVHAALVNVPEAEGPS